MTGNNNVSEEITHHL